MGKSEEVNIKLIASEKRMKDLEEYADLLRQKVEELEKANQALQIENQKLNRGVNAAETENFYEMYSTITKDCLKLKQKESENFENYTIICQEKREICC